MEWVNMPGKLSNWKFLRCFSSKETIGRNKQRYLVSVLASGTSAHPKKARDLTATI
jgi:hypothetical protein